MSMRVDVGPVSEIPPGEGRTFEAAGRKLAVFHNRDGRVFATEAVCPHRGGPLADGLVGDGAVVCPLHEWRFDLTTGKTQNGACDLHVYPTAVAADGRITVEVPGSPEP
jgi:nitrite reductase (NADH) small subunit